MSRHRAFYYPLIVVLLFGLAVSVMPVSPVLGSNLPVGVTLQQPNLSPNSLVRYSHTFLVGSGSSPTENGKALLSAREIISNSNPSAANPYLIKLEPGNYDLGNQSLTLLPFLDLEGSGEGTTVISSTVGQATNQFNKATLIAASNSETRFLQVTNFGSNPFQAGVLIPASATNVRFIHLTATTSGSSDTNVALYNQAGTINVTNSNFNSILSDSGSYGIYNDAGTINLANSTINASNGTFNNDGFYNHANGSAIITNSTITTSGKRNADGLFDDAGGLITIANSTLTSSVTDPTNSFVDAILINNAGAFTVSNSTLTALGGAQSYGIYNPTRGTVTVTNSTITALGGPVSIGVETIGIFATSRIANSQLRGTTAASFGVTLCPASINGFTFKPLNADCK